MVLNFANISDKFRIDTEKLRATRPSCSFQSKLHTGCKQICNRPWRVRSPLWVSSRHSSSICIPLHIRVSNQGITIPVIGDNQIKRVQGTKYLGVHLDENLRWNKHVNVRSKVSRSVSGLGRKARDNVNLDVLKRNQYTML